MSTAPCKLIPVRDDESRVEIFEDSIDHTKVLLLVQHLTKEHDEAGGEKLFDFFFNCSVLGLGFRLMDDVKNFEQLLEARINEIVFDLYDRAVLDGREDDNGNIVSVWVNDYVTVGYACHGEQELLDSAIHSMNELVNIIDEPLLVFDPSSKVWVENF